MSSRFGPPKMDRLPAVSGWLVGLPLTSGPVDFFLALDQGLAFAQAAAVGTLTGAMSQAAFCLAYSRLGSRWNWPLTMFVSALCFGVATAALQCLRYSADCCSDYLS
jgi:hypothetical protein